MTIPKIKPEIIKEIRKSLMKSNQCPECKRGFLRKKSYKNYPFGKKSKATYSTFKHCDRCSYMFLISPNLNKQKKKRRK